MVANEHQSGTGGDPRNLAMGLGRATGIPPGASAPPKETAMALLVFDSRSETNPFAGIKHWLREEAGRHVEQEKAKRHRGLKWKKHPD